MWYKSLYFTLYLKFYKQTKNQRTKTNKQILANVLILSYKLTIKFDTVRHNLRTRKTRKFTLFLFQFYQLPYIHTSCSIKSITLHNKRCTRL